MAYFNVKIPKRHVPIANPKLCYDELLIAYKVTWGSLYAELFSNLDLGQEGT
jgi:hypothetical protein